MASKAITFMPSARARRPVNWPMEPKPMMPRVLPAVSRPRLPSALRGHFPATTSPVEVNAPRSSIMVAVITYSATLSALAPVAGITAMPRASQAWHIDVVQPDTQPPDDAAAAQRGKQCATHLGAVAHDQGVGACRQLLQAGHVVDQVRVVENVVLGLQLRDGHAHP